MVDCWVYHYLLVLLKKMFIFMRELVIGIIPTTLPPITQAGMVDFWVALLLSILLKKVFMVIIGVI